MTSGILARVDARQNDGEKRSRCKIAVNVISDGANELLVVKELE